MTDAYLFRFLDAQDKFHRQAVGELAAGRKRTHWMWFVFPQLAGLGHSENARHFAIQDIDQARRYLEDPVLGSRLRDDVRLILGHKNKSALQIIGPPDHLKFQSYLTLFREAAGDEADGSPFSEALVRFYDGARDRRTLELLRLV